jgi:hypothetical protein
LIIAAKPSASPGPTHQENTSTGEVPAVVAAPAGAVVAAVTGAAVGASVVVAAGAHAASNNANTVTSASAIETFFFVISFFSFRKMKKGTFEQVSYNSPVLVIFIIIQGR